MQLLGSFGQQIDYIVPGQLGGRQGASEIVDLATGAVIRQGGT
jgi:tRNA A37 threonylcarbamoyladenosine synthetase subunit TsaC/SUA5/YrdC